MSDHREFQKLVEDGLHTDERISSYLMGNVLSDEDIAFMGKHRFDITMLLNGRIEEPAPWDEIKAMCERWNKELGFKLIFTEFM